MNTNILYKSGI